jgi:hypothetical protein
MREEIKQMRELLATLVRQGAAIENPNHGRAPTPGYHTHAGGDSESSPAMAALPPGAEDNMRMAMTRENSPEATSNGEQGPGGSVNVEEPMGSLYEVTRLRNIRSNKAKTARSQAGGNREVNDFISRGIISLPEAEDLYRRFVHQTL